MFLRNSHLHPNHTISCCIRQLYHNDRLQRMLNSRLHTAEHRGLHNHSHFRRTQKFHQRRLKGNNLHYPNRNQPCCHRCHSCHHQRVMVGPYTARTLPREPQEAPPNSASALSWLPNAKSQIATARLSFFVRTSSLPFSCMLGNRAWLLFGECTGEYNNTNMLTLSVRGVVLTEHAWTDSNSVEEVGNLLGRPQVAVNGIKFQLKLAIFVTVLDPLSSLSTRVDYTGHWAPRAPLGICTVPQPCHRFIFSTYIRVLTTDRFSRSKTCKTWLPTQRSRLEIPDQWPKYLHQSHLMNRPPFSHVFGCCSHWTCTGGLARKKRSTPTPQS